MYQPYEDQTTLLFPIVVAKREYGDIDFNETMYAEIKKLEADPAVENACDSTDVTTIGGFQPKLSLSEKFGDEPFFQKFLREIFHPGVQNYMKQHHRVAGWPTPGSTYRIETDWAVLYPKGAYQAPHLHREISCVFTYYVVVPERPKPEGGLTFINPHLESTFPLLKAWRYDNAIYPKAGTNVIFPGWMQHYSHPHFTDEERLILTFDVCFERP